jgi:glyoxylase I family protein
MTLNHINIVVSDIDKSLAFYVGVLNMRVTFEILLEGAWIESVVGLTGARAKCVFVVPDGGATNGGRIELLQYLTPEGVTLPQNSLANTIGLRHFALEVDDIVVWHEKLMATGVDFVSPPVSVPFSLGGMQKRLCYLHDPDGVIVEICDYRKVKAEAGA